MSLAALDSRFPQKRAVITGGASGLGLVAAELLAARVWNLALLDRDGARLTIAARGLESRGSPHCEAAIVDTTDETAVKSAIDAFAGRMSAYNVSKAAVVALSETLFQELAEHRVHVSVAMPGFFQTRLMETARAPADARGFALRLMERSNLEADVVAREIISKAADGATHIVLPASYRWLWRFKRLAPRTFQRWLSGFRQRRHSNGG